MKPIAPAYLIGNYQIKDPTLLAEYVQKATPIVQKFGGKMLVFNQEVKVLEGSCKPVFIVIEFPSLQEAEGFYNAAEYAPVKPLRLESTERGFLFLTERLPF